MQISETPTSVDQLDLMKKLEAYADGSASWLDSQQIGPNQKQACQLLHTNIVSLVNGMLVPLLTKVNAREMETFTMHDPKHALKVAHLMWHILHPDRRKTLTPPEIAILVISAFIHDLGMALSPEEREKRFVPTSDIWHRLELDETLKNAMAHLKKQISDETISAHIRDLAHRKLCQAEEVLLCQDTRERHASRERYKELLAQLQQFHIEDPTKLPDVISCLSFAGDSFHDKLIEICTSHGQDIDFLLANDDTNIERPRFPNDYTLGSCTADLHMCAVALRMADILDFDRERTPPVLFYYLLPTNLAPQDSKSILEWSKHLTISNWHIDQDAILFRGHCTNHIVHHAVEQFCDVIENEIKSTLNTFSVRAVASPFDIPTSVQTNIEQHGYTYVPYRFELDDHRVYELLMGGAIYDNPLVAVRELIQNAVDACKLRDSLDKMYEPQTNSATTNRIFISYEEPTDQCPQPKLTVRDTGTGMDRWIIEKYFLKVGQSYYRSADFNKTRLQLRIKNQELDFAPISEFGIGFLSCFLLADRLHLITAMWESIRGDTLKRNLIIDGPTRLIRQTEHKNEGLNRFKGTSVTLYLSSRSSGSKRGQPPQWQDIKEYIEDICQDLPYILNLEYHSSDKQITRDEVHPVPLVVKLPEDIDQFAIHIPVNDIESGLEGEIAIVNSHRVLQSEQELFKNSPTSISLDSETTRESSALFRGGFRIDTVNALPGSYRVRNPATARLRLNWGTQSDLRYPIPNLARSQSGDRQQMHNHVFRLWLDYLLQHIESLPEGLLYHLNSPHIGNPSFTWLERYDALTIYNLARQDWHFIIGDNPEDALKEWENGGGGSLRVQPWESRISQQLLDIVLPKIATLQMSTGKHGHIVFHVKPPKSDWRQILAEWRNFITTPVQWGFFVEYVGNIQDWLLYGYPGVHQFNCKFRGRLLDSFKEDELIPLFDILCRLAESRGSSKIARLPKDHITILDRACKYLGNFKIGDYHGSWQIDTFKPSMISQAP